MSREKRGYLIGVRTFDLCHPPQEHQHAVRVYPGAAHHEYGLSVGLAFRITAVFQEYTLTGQLSSEIRNGGPGSAAAEDHVDYSQTEAPGLRALNLLYAMPIRDVRDLVRQHPRYFAVGLSQLECSAVDVDVSTGKRESVYLR
jgi:hypothetical protein